MIRLLAFLVLAATLAGAAFWVYLRAEVPVARRRWLAGLRAATLVLLLSLLFDLRLPWGGPGAGARRWVLLDVSASMSAGGGSAWDGALARARELEAEGWTLVPFGDEVGWDGAADLEPRALRTELGPALTRAAEAGAWELRVLSDLRFEDPVAAASALAATPLVASFEAFGGAVMNAGLGAFSVADQVRRGEPVGAEVEVFSEGATDSLQVEVREEGVLILSRSVAPPAAGRRGRLSVELPAPRGEGRVRYTAHVALPGDVFPPDDDAAAYMMAGHEEGGLVLVSLQPDWEPRALLRVLGEATGLPATGYLRAGPDRFVPMGNALERGAPVDSASVRVAAFDAALLVLHGLDGRTDAWGRSLVTRRPTRVLLWPSDAAGAALSGVSSGDPQAGEWYASPEVRPSPLAGDLAGARLRDLPPLSGLLPLDRKASRQVPIEAQLGGTGPGHAALVLDGTGGGRRAVALASGFWRWEARAGAPREAYRRLWSGVAGWLLAEDPAGAAVEVRPARWVMPLGEPVTWWMPGSSPDSVHLEILDSAASVSVDTTLASGVDASTRPLPAGTYRYRATAVGEVRGEGRVDVEARSEEMLPPAVAPRPAAVADRGPRAAGSGGRPLRTSPWPYLLVLLLLSAEWVGRRRAGLR
ncbi:MAG: hypothetical protein Q8N53_05115 [Longimicrobiales bacterium]|nr:hypothetical protein [Longimicrobiales bacterium]